MDSKRLKKLKLSKPKTIPFTPNPSLLLHPNIPLPLHGTNPRTILGENWWNKERRATYKASSHHCQACGVHASEAKSRQWMEAHETYTINYKTGRMVYRGAVSLCHYCHAYLHGGRLIWLLETGQIHHAKYCSILQHGDRVLATAGLSRESKEIRDKKIHEQEIAPWGSWRLQIGRKLYPPKFKNYQQYWMAQQQMEKRDEN